MAFLNRVGNLLKKSMSNHVKSQFSVSNPSLLQAVRSMSSSKLFVGGLSYSTDEMSLREAFSQFGEVVEARVIMDRETGRSRGFGFVTFTSTDAASSAIQSFDGQDLHGRRIRVNYATEKPRGGGFGYGGGQGDGYRRGGYQGGGGGSYGGYGGGNQYPSDGGNFGGYGGGNQYPSDGGNFGGYSGGNQYPSGGGGYGGGSSMQDGGEDNFFGGGQTGVSSDLNDETTGGKGVGPLEEGFGNDDFEQGEGLDKDDEDGSNEPPKDYANTTRS